MNAPLFRLCAALGGLAVLVSSVPDHQSSRSAPPRAMTNVPSVPEPGAVEKRVGQSGNESPAPHSMQIRFPDAAGEPGISVVAGLQPVNASGTGEAAGQNSVSRPDFPATKISAGSPGSSSVPLLTTPNPAFTPAGANGRVTQAEVDALEAGLGQALSALEASLVEEVLSETLPLVGDRFSAAFDNNVAGFRYLNTLRTAVTGGLATLTAGPDYSPSQVASPINSRLASAGFASGSAVTVTTVNDQVQLAFVTSDTFPAAAVPIGSDLGLPNLDLDLLSPANASTVIAVVLRFTAGVDGTGFYVETNAPNTLFTINTTTTLSTALNAPVRFAKLPFRMNDRSAAPRTNVTANFVLSLRDPDNSDNSFKIRSGEFSGLPDLLDATVTGTAALNLAITSDLPVAAVMPKVRTDLTVTWSYTTPQTVDPDDNNQSFGNAPLFSLKNNSIHLNSFFNTFAEKVLNRIGDVTEPLDPLIAILTAEIPLLSDLDSEAVTILDVAGASEGEVAAIAGLHALNALHGTAADTVWANMGSFTYNGDPRTALLSEVTPALTSVPAARPPELDDFLKAAHAVEGLAFPLLENTNRDPDGHVLADLLMGRPADLFAYKSGTIELEERFGPVFFPVLGPVGVTLGGRAGVLTRFGFGFDTQGVFDYYGAGASATPDMIFNGFYAIAADENGDPFTGISLYAGITAGVAANIGFASIGVEGDITAEIGFWLDENAGDQYGRVRGDMFASLPIDDLFHASGSLSAGLRAYVEVGIGPFSVGYDWESPRVTLISFDDHDDEVPTLAELDPADLTKLILNVGGRAPRRIYGPTDDRAEEFTIKAGLDSIVVGAFDEENSFPPPSLIIGNPNERGDVIEMDPNVAVPARLHGGDGRDVLKGGAMGDELYGDAGPDKLEGRGGDDTLRGGDGNDELMGGSGADIMDGGPGEDTASWLDSPLPIVIDLRTSYFGGEAALDTLISIERYKGSPFDDTLDGSDGFDALLNGGPGNDTIRGNRGDDNLEGGGGNDNIQGGAGNDLINGGPGADIMDGGPGTDILSYLSPSPPGPPPGVVLEPVTVNLKTGLGTRGEAAGDVVTGFEILYGSGVPAGVTNPFASGDDLTGSDNADTIHGMGGSDLIHGGDGNDVLYGDNAEATEESFMAGFDADTIYGDAGDDQIFGQTDNDKLYGGDGNDTLDGGLGDDTLDSGTGNNTMLGGAGDDHLISNNPAGIDILDGGSGYNRLSADYTDKTTPLNFTVGQNNAHTFPDDDRFSFMQTLGSLTCTSASDVIRLAAAKEPYFYPKTILAGAGNDLVIADWRGFYTQGMSSQRSGDSLHGGDGNDTISFEQSISGITANLATLNLGGAAAGMTMSGFENIIGSHHVDTLTGDAGNNIFYPLDSPTPIANGQLFTEAINGGDGVDTLVIDCSAQPDANALGVFMSPNAGSAPSPISFGGIVGQWFPFVRYSHQAIEIFHLTGGDEGDHFYGEGVFGAYPDIFIGRGGNDHLEGRGGNDLLDGGDGDDELEAGAGNDKVIGGPGNDAISFVRSDNFSSGYGQDEVDAGPGDDSIFNLVNTSIGSSTTASAGTVFKCDGGDGYDTLSADFGIQTQPIIWDQSKPNNITFPDGSYIRNIERLAYFYATSGNDVFLFQGRENTQISLLGGNDIINPGIGTDTIRGGSGDDLVIIDYRVGDDADTSGVTYENALSPVHFERRRLSDHALLDYLVMVECERMYCTGSSKNDELTGLIGNDVILGGPGNDQIDGDQGNDYLDGGPEADQMIGGPGSDFYVVDNAGDTVRELNTSGFDQGGVDTVRSSVSFTLPTAVEILNLTGSALNGTGNASANTITGNAKNNILQGLNGNDTLNGGGGPNEIDRLNGGLGSDTFVLGDGGVRFYDDGDPLSPGLGGYAIIEDFTPSQTDKLRLTGSAAQYFLGVSPIAGLTGTALYHDSNGSGVLEPATDELIAIIISAVTLTPANTLTPGTYPPPVTPESLGLTAPPVVTTINDATGSHLQLQFTISEPMPAGALLEIQASTDLGIDDPWQTIAVKNGPAAWTGLVPVTVGTPVNGRVTVTLTDIQPEASVARRFLKFHITAP